MGNLPQAGKEILVVCLSERGQGGAEVWVTLSGLVPTEGIKKVKGFILCFS